MFDPSNSLFFTVDLVFGGHGFIVLELMSSKTMVWQLHRSEKHHWKPQKERIASKGNENL